MIDLRQEYRIVSAAAGWRLSTRRALLRMAGRDASSFLHALVTADVASVAPGGGVYAAYLTPQGRMICDMALYRQPDAWLADVPAAAAASLSAKLDAAIFTEDVRVEDGSGQLAIVTLVGADAARILGAAAGLERSQIESLPLRGILTASEITAARTDATALPSFDLLLPRGAAADVTARLAQAGAAAMSDALGEALRVEAGRPSFGVDMDTDTIPLEAGLLDRAISTTKGCYVGQEIIIRVLHRGGGRVARRLMKLESSEAGAAIEPGAVIVAGGKDVGAVTSAARSPVRDRAIALGYVQRDAAEAGGPVVVRQDGVETAAVIVGAAG